MTGSGYLALLRLTEPEIIVALTGLLVLVLDLSFLRRTSLAARFRGAVAASSIGCAIRSGSAGSDSLLKAAGRVECWSSTR